MTRNIDILKLIRQKLGYNADQFAMALGYSNSQSYKNIEAGHDAFSHVLKKRLIRIFNVSSEFLETGQGEMFTGGQSGPLVIAGTRNDHRQGIPYYEIAATMSPLVVYADEKEIPLYYIDMPALKGCDFALPAWGDSMYPKIKNGQIIAVKEIKDRSQIQWGEIYLVVTDEIRAVKYVRRHPNSKLVILASENRENFDDITIERDKIHGLFIVKGQINILVN